MSKACDAAGHVELKGIELPIICVYMGIGQSSKPCTPSVHIKIAGKWMFIPLKCYPSILYIYIMKVFHGNTISEIPSGNFRMCEMDNHHFNSENHLDMGHVSWL